MCIRDRRSLARESFAEWLLQGIADRRIEGTSLIIDLRLDDALIHSVTLRQFCNRLMPVSYTHLDVYKRQATISTALVPSSATMRPCTRPSTYRPPLNTRSPCKVTCGPVSYTHLDVYKRQAKAIPIAGARENPEMMQRAFDEIDAALADGQIVGIFPEGCLLYTSRCV